MFDMGFWELALLAVIGLIVLGPERLPNVARTMGLWAGRARMYMRNLSSELEREVNTSELRRNLESARSEVEQGGRRLEAEVRGDDEGDGQKASNNGDEASPDVGADPSPRRVAPEVAEDDRSADDDGDRR